MSDIDRVLAIVQQKLENASATLDDLRDAGDEINSAIDDTENRIANLGDLIEALQSISDSAPYFDLNIQISSDDI